MQRTLLFLVISFLLACNNPAKKVTTNSTQGTVATHLKIEPDKLIVPGKSIGNIAIGLPVDSAIVQLGRPDSSDAAMGSELLTWKDAKHYRTAIFAGMDMGNETIKRIKRIMVGSPAFSTEDGISTGASAAEIEKRYNVRQVADATAKQKGLIVLDDNDKGITFDLDSIDRKCIAITVHKIREGAGSYINMH